MLRFMDGASHYNTAQLTAKWNDAPGCTVISNGGRFGDGGIQVPYTGRLLKTLDAKSTWIVGFAFYPAGFPTTNAVIVKLLDAGSVQVDLRINSDGTLSLTRNGAPLTGGTSAFALQVGAWYYIEMKVTIANSILANTCQVKVNNAVVIDVAAGQDTQETANTTANAIELKGSVPNSTFDDIYICDTVGGVCTDFLGDSRIYTMLPNAAGDSTQFTVVNTGNNWKAVSNNPSLGDGMYVYSVTPGQLDLYNLQDLVLAGPIKAIQTNLFARKDDAGARTMAAVIKTGGIAFDGAAVPLAVSYLFYTEVRELNPDTLVAWTPADLVALQAGVKLVA
jgi:hypothetical protein